MIQARGRSLAGAASLAAARRAVAQLQAEQDLMRIQLRGLIARADRATAICVALFAALAQLRAGLEERAARSSATFAAE